MPHIPQDKSDKTRESLTYWGLKELQYGDKAPLKPHISRGGEGGGGLGVYFDWCINPWRLRNAFEKLKKKVVCYLLTSELSPSLVFLPVLVFYLWI